MTIAGSSYPVIEAERAIDASQSDVYRFLSNIDNHWLLADRFVEVVDLNGRAPGTEPGGRVRIRGPFGLSRTAATEIVEVRPISEIAGTAEIGNHTQAVIRWSLQARSARETLVRLEARVQSGGLLDRLLLAAGGRPWLARRFANVLATLEERIAG